MTRDYKSYERTGKSKPGMRVLFLAQQPSDCDLDEALGRFLATPYGRKGECDVRDFGSFTGYCIYDLFEYSSCGVFATPDQSFVLVGFRTEEDKPKEQSKETLDTFVNSFVQATGMQEIVTDASVIRAVADKYEERF